MLRINPASNLSVVSAKSMMAAESLRCPSTCYFLSACAPPKNRPHLRTAEADTSTQTRWSLAPVVVALWPLSLFFSPSLRSRKFLLCRLSLSLSFSCSGVGVLYFLSQQIASKDLLPFRHSSTPLALSALTSARLCRSQDQSKQLWSGSGACLKQKKTS